MDPFLIVFAALLPAIVLICYIFRKDSLRPEPKGQLIRGFFFGVISAFIVIISSALFGNGSYEIEFLSDAFYQAFFQAAIPEEIAKLFMLWLLIRRNKYFDEHLDGIVYSVCIGMGFAGFENILYLIDNYNEWVSVGVIRALISVPGHFFFAVAMGYFISLAYFGNRKKRLYYIAMAIFVPILLHGIFDMLLMSFDITSSFLSLIIVILFMVFFRKLRQYASQKIIVMTKEDKELFKDEPGGKINSKGIVSHLSGSLGKQLKLILTYSIIAIVFFSLCWEVYIICHNDSNTNIIHSLNDILALFLDPGTYGDSSVLPTCPSLFRLLITITGVVLFTIILNSIITAWFTNINENVYNGNRRYNLYGHVIIFGGGDQLEGILSSFIDSGKDVLVVSPQHPSVKSSSYFYYKGDRDDESMVRQCNPGKADTIYIIGEDHESGHDSRSLKCLEVLKKITANENNRYEEKKWWQKKEKIQEKIHCFVTFDDQESSEVFLYLNKEAGHLSNKLILVDAINEYEYRAEQFILNAPFTPVIKKESEKSAHFILFGAGKVAQAMAYTIAHACHYPKLNGSIRKTFITIIDPDILKMRNRLMAARPFLFEASEYETIARDGKVESHMPEKDYLDIAWRFVEGGVNDNNIIDLFTQWSNNENLETRIIVCEEESGEAIPTVLHLPQSIYEMIPVAVYLEDSHEIIGYANKSLMFGKEIIVFGPVSETLSDPLLKERSERGKRVNFVYEKKYPTEGKTLDNPDEAWYERCEADKFSSIYCALGLPLREKTFDISTDEEEIYEVEHRRWMMSEYIMGFRYAEEKDKVHFKHNDLVPYEELPESEKSKDAILIKNCHYILTGEGEPVIL